jgi:hypothetical protein
MKMYTVKEVDHEFWLFDGNDKSVAQFWKREDADFAALAFNNQWRPFSELPIDFVGKLLVRFPSGCFNVCKFSGRNVITDDGLYQYAREGLGATHFCMVPDTKEMNNAY